MPVRIKICGITRLEDARVAVSLGVDALGFIFHPKSPRYITPSNARKITRQLPAFVARVGLFVNQTTAAILETAHASGMDTLQLHGQESPEQCAELPYPVVKAFSVNPTTDISLLAEYPVAGILLDTWDENLHGGTGKTFDWTIAQKAALKYPNVVLAGGLGPTNLAEALDTVAPYAVDLNSGVEIRPGEKNPHKMREAVTIVRNWKPA